jgi:hypothetical protein
MGEGLKRARAAAKSTQRKPTLADAMEAIAESLRQFGYPDATAQMIRETYDAWLGGARNDKLPHGIIGMFAESQISEHAEMLARLPK